MNDNRYAAAGSSRFPLLRDPDRLEGRLAGAVMAIGNFDGAHRGHGAVAAQARRMAEALQTERPGVPRPAVLALTFDPHPRRYFQPDVSHFRLSDPRVLTRSLERIGFEGVITLSFDADLASMAAEDFVTKILVGRFGVAGVVVGEDFHFGRGRAGTPQFLREMGETCGFRTVFVPPFRDENGEIISSSAIRAALQKGDVASANAMLGAPFTLAGTVIHGEKRGRTLGYPTANIRLDPACQLAHGIYAVRLRHDSVASPAVASFGTRPHFDNGAPLLEVHVFDFSGDLYGETVEVEFAAFLRPEAKFASLEALIAQMDSDSRAARAILAG